MSAITEHVYVSRSGWPWDVCVCGLARSAHATEDQPYVTDRLPYRCPDCVTRDAAVCLHREVFS